MVNANANHQWMGFASVFCVDSRVCLPHRFQRCPEPPHITDRLPACDRTQPRRCLLCPPGSKSCTCPRLWETSTKRQRSSRTRRAPGGNNGSGSLELGDVAKTDTKIKDIYSIDNFHDEWHPPDMLLSGGCHLNCSLWAQNEEHFIGIDANSKICSSHQLHSCTFLSSYFLKSSRKYRVEFCAIKANDMFNIE